MLLFRADKWIPPTKQVHGRLPKTTCKNACAVYASNTCRRSQYRLKEQGGGHPLPSRALCAEKSICNKSMASSDSRCSCSASRQQVLACCVPGLVETLQGLQAPARRRQPQRETVASAIGANSQSGWCRVVRLPVELALPVKAELLFRSDKRPSAGLVQANGKYGLCASAAQGSQARVHGGRSSEESACEVASREATGKERHTSSAYASKRV